MRRERDFFILLFALLILLSCKDNTKVEVSGASYTPDAGTSAVAVEAQIVKIDKLINKVSGSGIIRGKEEAWSITETSGIITEVFVSPGDYVVEGDPLLKVNDNLAYWDMKRAEQAYLTADFEYKGIKDSFSKGAVTQVDYNRAYSNWFNTRSGYEVALESYANCTVKAPVSGYVSQMDTTLSEGNLLNRGIALLKVVNTEEFIITIPSGQREVGLIEQGAQANIFIDQADGTILRKGYVLDISAGSDELTGSFPIRIVWNNSGSSLVKPGMTARVEIETVSEEEGLIIPFNKIVKREGKDWVFVAIEGDEGYFAGVKEVVTGTRLGNRVKIEKGLVEGDILITSGFSALQKGSPVTLTIEDKKEVTL